MADIAPPNKSKVLLGEQYEDSPLAVLMKRDDREELIQLPTDDLAVEKALTRVGALLDSDCEITLDSDNTGAFSHCFMRVIQDEGLYAANELIRQIDDDLDWTKLPAVAEFTGAHKAEDIAFIAERLDDFVFAPYAMNEEDVGNYLVNNCAEYGLHEDMEGFFDFQGFGESIVERLDGRFVGDGFVCYTGDGSLDELLDMIDVEEAEDEEMNMGGI